MKTIKARTEEILAKALELKDGSELYLECGTDRERDVLYDDLIQRRFWFIEDGLSKYEQIIITKKHFNIHPNIILAKLNILSAYIRKANGSREEITL